MNEDMERLQYLVNAAVTKLPPNRSSVALIPLRTRVCLGLVFVSAELEETLDFLCRAIRSQPHREYVPITDRPAGAMTVAATNKDRHLRLVQQYDIDRDDFILRFDVRMR